MLKPTMIGSFTCGLDTYTLHSTLTLPIYNSFFTHILNRMLFRCATNVWASLPIIVPIRFPMSVRLPLRNLNPFCCNTYWRLECRGSFSHVSRRGALYCGARGERKKTWSLKSNHASSILGICCHSIPRKLTCETPHLIEGCQINKGESRTHTQVDPKSQ